MYLPISMISRRSYASLSETHFPNSPFNQYPCMLTKWYTLLDGIFLPRVHRSAAPPALAAAGIAVTIVNPRQLRDFARVTGKLAQD
jgi:hypothetical protein